jgi:hypothetical protein
MDAPSIQPVEFALWHIDGVRSRGVHRLGFIAPDMRQVKNMRFSRA